MEENSMLNMQPLSAVPRQRTNKCDTCTKTFRRRDDYDRHQFLHAGVYTYPCQEKNCCKTFTNRSHLLRHMQTKHLERSSASSPKVWNCEHPNCTMQFARKHAMKRHYMLEHAKQFRCEECNKLLRTKRNLKVHAQVHLAEDAQEVYECPYAGCTRFYTYKRNLNIHVRSKHRSTKSEE